MWKVESLTMNEPAAHIECLEQVNPHALHPALDPKRSPKRHTPRVQHDRIKHIVTNKYLFHNPNSQRLEMTDDYLAPGAEVPSDPEECPEKCLDSSSIAGPGSIAAPLTH